MWIYKGPELNRAVSEPENGCGDCEFWSVLQAKVFPYSHLQVFKLAQNKSSQL